MPSPFKILFFLASLGLPSFGEIHPVITEHCTKCHGGVKQKGGLDLRTIGSAIEGGETDTSLLPGDPEKSPNPFESVATKTIRVFGENIDMNIQFPPIDSFGHAEGYWNYSNGDCYGNWTFTKD